MPTRFTTQAQRDVFMKVRGYLDELFGPVAQDTEKAPVLLLALGSAAAEIFVQPWGEGDAAIVVRAHVVFGAKVDNELCCFLLHENARLRFGGFALTGKGDVVFEHDLLGSTCPPAALKNAVLSVLKTADDYDDQIQARWGGQRALDVVQ
jgi:hypothetical protein